MPPSWESIPGLLKKFYKFGLWLNLCHINADLLKSSLLYCCCQNLEENLRRQKLLPTHDDHVCHINADLLKSSLPCCRYLEENFRRQKLLPSHDDHVCYINDDLLKSSLLYCCCVYLEENFRLCSALLPVPGRESPARETSPGPWQSCCRQAVGYSPRGSSPPHHSASIQKSWLKGLSLRLQWFSQLNGIHQQKDAK